MTAACGSLTTRLLAVTAALAVAALTPGCAAPGGPHGNGLPQPGRLALSVDAADAAVKISGVPRRRVDPDIRASDFPVRCLRGSEQTGEVTVLFFAWLLGCGVASEVATVIEDSRTDVAPATAVVLHRLEPERLAHQLRASAAQAADAIAPGRLAVERDATTDGDLRISVAQVLLTGDDQPDPRVRIGLEFRASVEPDGGRARAHAFSYLSASRRLSEWSEGAGTAVVELLATVLPRVAQAAVETTFLQYPTPPPGRGGQREVTGLRVEHPPPSGGAVIASRRPTFRWEAFPGPADLSADPERMTRVTDVAYDLVIATNDGGVAGPTVYARTALPANEHRLESDLAPDTSYFWTVRARFVLDGLPLVTPWAARERRDLSLPLGMRKGALAPDASSHSFSTGR